MSRMESPGVHPQNPLDLWTFIGLSTQIWYLDMYFIGNLIHPWWDHGRIISGSRYVKVWKQGGQQKINRKGFEFKANAVRPNAEISGLSKHSNFRDVVYVIFYVWK